MAYPAPSRFRWVVLAELPDGTTIHGTSSEDLIDRWARLHSWDGTDWDRARLMRSVHDRLATFWCSPPDVPPTTTDYDAWLEAVNRTGVVTIIRKD